MAVTAGISRRFKVTLKWRLACPTQTLHFIELNKKNSNKNKMDDQKLKVIYIKKNKMAEFIFVNSRNPSCNFRYLEAIDI